MKIRDLEVGRRAYVSKAAIVRNPGKGGLLINTSFNAWRQYGVQGTVRIRRTPVGYEVREGRQDVAASLRHGAVPTPSLDQLSSCRPISI